MKSIYKIQVLLLLVLASCGLKSEKNDQIAENDLAKQTISQAQVENKVDSNPINKKIIGIWWSSDTSAPSAAFEIDKKRVFYVDALKYCKYKIESDSLKIEVDKDYWVSYGTKFKGKDTLILAGESIDTFHRGK